MRYFHKWKTLVISLALVEQKNKRNTVKQGLRYLYLEGRDMSSILHKCVSNREELKMALKRHCSHYTLSGGPVSRVNDVKVRSY